LFLQLQRNQYKKNLLDRTLPLLNQRNCLQLMQKDKNKNSKKSKFKIRLKQFSRRQPKDEESNKPSVKY
jgi:hypothetical protein